MKRLNYNSKNLKTRFSKITKEIEQEFDRLSHHEHIMQDCSYNQNALDEAEQNINQEVSSILRRLESHAGRVTNKKFMLHY